MPKDPRNVRDRRADGPGEPGNDAAAGSIAESGGDLDAPAGSEEGSLAALLGGIASAPAAAPPVELTPGSDLGTVYQIVRRIGAGGMGVVYLARDLELQRDVAVKVHRAAVGTERLYREAVAMAQLAHPNVVTIHGVGRVNGQLYIAMEYVPGDNLSDWQAAAKRSWREVLDVMLGAGEGLAAAHDAGFVHRDIKPQNILVGLDQRPRIGDFGLVSVASDGLRPELAGDEALRAEVTQPLARARVEPADPRPRSRPPSSHPPTTRPSGASPRAGDLTAVGTTLGTPSYMAPEQLAGQVVDARADQFGYCVVLYEALHGQRPWPGNQVAELREQVTRTPPREPTRTGVPAWVWPVLRRGLAIDPAGRYPDMRALLAALRSPPRRALIAGAATVAVAIAAIAAVAIVGARTAAPRAASCDAAGTPVVAAWGPSARSKIAAHYARLDPFSGPEAANQLATAIDAWSMHWQRAAVTSCEATRAHRWSPAIAAASDRCLQASLVALRTLVARAKVSPVVVADATSLPEVDRCAEPQLLVGGTSAPADAIEGHWRGDFGHLLLRRVGDEIWGVYGHDVGTVRGRMVGDTFVGWWCEVPSRKPPGDAGDVEMRVIVDGDGVRAIAGRWRYGADGDWDDRWDLKAAPGTPAAALTARFDAPAEFCLPPAPPTPPAALAAPSGPPAPAAPSGPPAPPTPPPAPAAPSGPPAPAAM